MACPPLHLSRDTVSYSLVRFCQAFTERKISGRFPSRSTLHVATFVSQDASLYEIARQKQTGRKFILALLLPFLNKSIKTQHDLTKGR